MTDPLTPYVDLTATPGGRKPRGNDPHHTEASAPFTEGVSL